MENNSAIAHNFIYGISSKGSNFYSSDYNYISELHSYSSLMAIKFKSENLIIISSHIAGYSNTSCKHHNHLQRAINNENIIYVNDISCHDNSSNNNPYAYLNNDTLNDKIYEYIEVSKKQKKARKRDYSSILNKLINELKLIVKYGTIDKRKTNYKTYLSIINNIDLDTLLNDAIEEEKKQLKRDTLKRYKSNLKQLETFTGVSLKSYSKSELNNFNFLKIDGDYLLTSGHVKVLIKEACILYKMLISGRDIVGKKIAYYTIIKHDKKSVKIGCHNILLKELERVLKGCKDV